MGSVAGVLDLELLELDVSVDDGLPLGELGLEELEVVGVVSVAVAETEGDADPALVVLSLLFSTLRRAPPTLFSSYSASTAASSFGKTPSRNLADRTCRALWTDSSLMLASSSRIACRWDTASTSTACSAAKTDVRARADRSKAWKKPVRSMVG